MCLTTPVQVEKINKRVAWVHSPLAYFRAGLTVPEKPRQVNISALREVRVGDWLLSTSDWAVKKISAKEAKEILELLGEHRDIDLDELSPLFKKILEAARRRDLTPKEIIYLLGLKGSLEQKALFSEADVIRRSYVRDFICLHGIIEFSNFCQNNCLYCGIRSRNIALKRYRMKIPEIVRLASEAVNKIGYKMLVLQSGLDLEFSDEALVHLVRAVKKKCRAFLFMSVGERSLACYEKMKKAGANGILLRFETANPLLYRKFHPPGTLKGDFQNRFKILKECKKMGYYISSGPLIGLPGQTLEDLARDILTIKKLGVGMVSLGPFVPAKNTPLEKEQPGSVDLTLKMMAVSRLVMKKTRIPATSALETLAGEKIREKALRSGANSLMFNLTPKKYRRKYEIYPGKKGLRDLAWEALALFPQEGAYKMLEREMRVKV